MSMKQSEDRSHQSSEIISAYKYIFASEDWPFQSSKVVEALMDYLGAWAIKERHLLSLECPRRAG